MRPSELIRSIRAGAWDDVRDAYGPAGPVADHLVRLVEGAGEDPSDAYQELMGRIWHQGTVYAASARAIPFLVAMAESLEEPRSIAALGLLLAIASGTADDPVRQRIDAALVSAAERLDAIAGCGDGRARLAAQAARMARDPAERAADVRALLDDVDGALDAWTDRELAHAATQPGALDARIRACRFGEKSAELATVQVVSDCLRAGRPSDAIALCEKLRICGLLGEPHRIQALVQLGRLAEARTAAVALAEAWLLPADSTESANQALLKRDVLEPLSAVRRATGTSDLDELIASVSRSNPEVFIPGGTDSF